MIDTTTGQPLSVSTAGGAAAYIMLPLAQLDEMTKLLDKNEISYWVDEEALSLDGEPEVIWINLKRGSNAAIVQSLLDSIY